MLSKIFKNAFDVCFAFCLQNYIRFIMCECTYVHFISTYVQKSNDVQIFASLYGLCTKSELTCT